MVDESERVWFNIDDIRKSIGDHCVRLTKLEQTHFNAGQMKEKTIIYLLAGIATLEFIFIAIERLVT